MSIASIHNQSHTRTIVVRRDPCMRCADLTPRQMDVLHLMAQGMTNRQIGARLGISQWTVHIHADNIFATLGVRKRTQAATLYLRYERWRLE